MRAGIAFGSGDGRYDGDRPAICLDAGDADHSDHSDRESDIARREADEAQHPNHHEDGDAR